jgi:HSP20 family protein
MARSMLERWDPFRDLMSIQNEMNRLFGRTFGDGSELGFGGTWVPAIDVHESVDKIEVSVDLPGIDPKDVDVTVEDSTLTITGERRFAHEEQEGSFQRIERRYGAFSRTVTLPSTADTERIDAEFDRGVLTIKVPKREEAKPKKITVKAS